MTLDDYSSRALQIEISLLYMLRARGPGNLKACQ